MTGGLRARFALRRRSRFAAPCCPASPTARLPFRATARRCGHSLAKRAAGRSILRPMLLALRTFSNVTGLALLASRIVCLIVIAWFAVFAIGQSGSASTSQTNKVAAATEQPLASEAPVHESSAKKTLNDVAKAVTSPFQSLTSKSSSAWLQHGEDTLLALLIYGVGVGFLARIVRLRV